MRAGLDRGRCGRCGSGLVYATVIGLTGRGRTEPSALIGWMPPAGVDFGYVWIGGEVKNGGVTGVGEMYGRCSVKEVQNRRQSGNGYEVSRD